MHRATVRSATHYYTDGCDKRSRVTKPGKVVVASLALALKFATMKTMQFAPLTTMLLLLACLPAAGCGEAGNSIGRLDLVWGRRGISDGRLQKPRAMTIDNADNL